MKSPFALNNLVCHNKAIGSETGGTFIKALYSLDDKCRIANHPESPDESLSLRWDNESKYGFQAHLPTSLPATA